MRDTVEVNDEFTASILHHGLQSVVELVAGLTDGQAAVNFEQVNTIGLTDGDFHGDMFGHGGLRRNDSGHDETLLLDAL